LNRQGAEHAKETKKLQPQRREEFLVGFSFACPWRLCGYSFSLRFLRVSAVIVFVPAFPWRSWRLGGQPFFIWFAAS
jgi:hypothetical protein